MSVGRPDGGASAPVEAVAARTAGGGTSQEPDSGGAHAIRASPATASGASAHGDQLGWDEGLWCSWGQSGVPCHGHPGGW